MDVIKRRKQTNKPGIDFFLSSNLCLSSLRRKIMPPSQLNEAQKIRQLSSRMGRGRLTLCWCLRRIRRTPPSVFSRKSLRAPTLELLQPPRPSSESKVCQTLSHLLLRCANPQNHPQDIITYLHHSLQLHISPHLLHRFDHPDRMIPQRSISDVSRNCPKSWVVLFNFYNQPQQCLINAVLK